MKFDKKPWHTHHVRVPSMCRKVVHWHIYALSFLQPLQRGDKKRDVKGIWVIKIVLVAGCLVMLFLIQNLWHSSKVHTNKMQWCRNRGEWGQGSCLLNKGTETRMWISFTVSTKFASHKAEHLPTPLKWPPVNSGTCTHICHQRSWQCKSCKWTSTQSWHVRNKRNM